MEDARSLRPHPDYAEVDLPREAEVGEFRLTPLAPALNDEDFAVVIESADVLHGLFGPKWPLGLTLEENLADLTAHDRAFEIRAEFSWIIRDQKGIYLGCAYLDPAPGKPGAGRVYSWVRKRRDRLALLDAFNAVFADWLTPYLPDGYHVTWKSNDWAEPEAARR